MDFLNVHFPLVVTVLSSATISLITLGVFKARFIVLEEKVTRMDNMGSRFTSENSIEIRSKLQYLESRVNATEERHERMMDVLQEIKTDVKVIEGWIQTQNKNHARQH